METVRNDCLVYECRNLFLFPRPLLNSSWGMCFWLWNFMREAQVKIATKTINKSKRYMIVPRDVFFKYRKHGKTSKMCWSFLLLFTTPSYMNVLCREPNETTLLPMLRYAVQFYLISPFSSLWFRCHELYNMWNVYTFHVYLWIVWKSLEVVSIFRSS